MKNKSFKSSWTELRDRLERDAQAQKIPEASTFELICAYNELNKEKQEEVNALLREWVLSEDENVRYDALALINEYKIFSALKVLEFLKAKLAKSHEPGARYEKTKVERIITKLLREVV